jgi:gliding motility associated protien GldN
MNILQSYKFAVTAALIVVSSAAYAQPATTDKAVQNTNYPGVKPDWQPSLVKDGVFDRAPHVSLALPWQTVREADVMWMKKVWRELDTREKQNVAFRFPGDENSGGGMFIEIILDAIKRGKIKAYSNFDDRFTSALTKEQVLELVAGKVDSTPVEDPVTGVVTIRVTKRDFNPDIITKYRIKEEVVFDRNLGRQVTRIIGLAPFKDIYNDDGSYRVSQALFWLYFPEIRNTLAQYEVFNPENDVARMTWDDYFENRFFSSRIIKISNPFDVNFKEGGATNMEALYQGQHTAEKLFNKEHDMWVY